MRTFAIPSRQLLTPCSVIVGNALSTARHSSSRKSSEDFRPLGESCILGLREGEGEEKGISMSV